jgi:protein SCO1/2
MAGRHVVPHPEDSSESALDSAFWLVLVLAAACVVLVGIVLLRGSLAPATTPPGSIGTSPAAGAAASAPASPGPQAILYEPVRDAPPIELVDPSAHPFSLSSLRGHEVLVFFGYTHCPDVCPITIGVVSQALAAVGPDVRAVFVTVDPERDTTASLSDYVRYLPASFTALTGTPAQIRTTADAWGVRYTRVETGTPGAYSMSHTADVYLVDAAGRLRAHFPFGTQPPTMIELLRSVAASTAEPVSSASPGAAAPSPTGPPAVATPVSSASATPTTAVPPTAGALRVEIVSTSVWSGGSSPAILALYVDSGRLADASVDASVQLTRPDGSPVGAPAQATAVQPPGVERVSFVAVLDIPNPGPWRLGVSAVVGGTPRTGSVDFSAFDPGSTAPLGAAAPAARTPTLADTGGDPKPITTVARPDLRLSERSTADALAAHTPFVLVIDSARFRVSTACGKAIAMAGYMADRWPGVAFIHLEPFVYSIVTEEPVLGGDISNPPLGSVAAAWGVGGSPWGGLSMPWVFVVDGDGIVRAKYQGLVGTDDVDVILSLIEGG